MQITRRSFLKGTVAANAAFPLFTIAGTKASGRVLGANEVIRVGIAGIHGQGNAHIDQYLGFKDVQVTHLIDPDRSLFASRCEKIRQRGGNTPKCFPDFENMRSNLEAVGVNLTNTKYQLGRVLKFDPKRERFVGFGARKADAFLSRNYRPPFVVPTAV
ncbi:MAG TPA: hypothetical protein VEO53_13540 [Candidatus Binatia bacterium]|nr:hypothetical protein [Candidatus Binatia bacterium]